MVYVVLSCVEDKWHDMAKINWIIFKYIYIYILMGDGW